MNIHVIRNVPDRINGCTLTCDEKLLFAKLLTHLLDYYRYLKLKDKPSEKSKEDNLVRNFKLAALFISNTDEKSLFTFTNSCKHFGFSPNQVLRNVELLAKSDKTLSGVKYGSNHRQEKEDYL